MLRTMNLDEEVHKQFKFQLCITLLSGTAKIFEQYVYQRIGERRNNGDVPLPPILESFVFGGTIGWYCMAESENKVGIPFPTYYAIYINCVQLGLPYQEARDDDYMLLGCKKFKSQYIDAILMGHNGMYHVMREKLQILITRTAQNE